MDEQTPLPEPPSSFEVVPPWSPVDLERLMAEPTNRDLKPIILELANMPDTHDLPWSPCSTRASSIQLSQPARHFSTRSPALSECWLVQALKPGSTRRCPR